MGVFSRPDSRYWWLWLETVKQKERTIILVGTTTAERKLSRRAADELYHQRMLEIAAGHYGLATGAATRTRTLTEQIAWYDETILPLHRGAEREREVLSRLRQDMGRTLLTALDRPRIQAWIRDRLGTVAPATVNREMDVLKAVLREAVPTWIRQSPIAGMKRLRVTTRPRRRLLQVDEEERLLDELEPIDRAVLIMGLDTLCRFGDIVALRRTDDHTTVLYIREPKNGEPYEVPVSARLRQALDRLPDAGAFYFERYRRAKMFRDQRATFRKRFREACERAKVPYGRKHDGITFHWATRRTGATRMIAAGVDVRTVAEVGNWRRPDVLLSVYTESNAAAKRAAVEVPGTRAAR